MNAVFVRILAKIDALLLPEPGEGPGFDTVQNRRFQHIEQYRRFGIPWRPAVLNPGRDAKQSERDLTHMVNTGALVTPTARRREFVRLTPRSHAQTRLLIGWPASIDAAFDVMVKMDRAKRLAAVWQGKRWLPLDCRGAKGRACVLFALGHGWIQADSDSHGTVIFTITDAGMQSLKSGLVEDVDGMAVPAMKRLYEETHAEALREIPTLPLLHPHDMHINGAYPKGLAPRGRADVEGAPPGVGGR